MPHPSGEDQAAACCRAVLQVHAVHTKSVLGRVIGVATVQYESLLKSKTEAKQRSLALTYSHSAQAQAQGHAIHPVLA